MQHRTFEYREVDHRIPSVSTRDTIDIAPSGTSHIRFDGKKTDRGFPPMPIGSLRSQSRSNERRALLLNQKKGPDAVMVGVLSVALLLGLIGLAVHVLWVVAIIVMALGLGFTVANSRRNRIDVVNQRAEERSDAFSAQGR
jgi:hypothetical protein